MGDLECEVCMTVSVRFLPSAPLASLLRLAAETERFSSCSSFVLSSRKKCSCCGDGSERLLPSRGSRLERADCFTICGDSCPCNARMQCKDVASKDWLSKSDPMVEMWLKKDKDSEYELAGQTECQKDTTSPT